MPNLVADWKFNLGHIWNTSKFQLQYFAEYPFLYLSYAYLPDPSGTLTLNLKLHATLIKSKKALQNVPLGKTEVRGTFWSVFLDLMG